MRVGWIIACIISALLGALTGEALWHLFISRARASETMGFERVVPAGATLSYSERGSIVRTINVPEGRVRVVITYGGEVTPRHERQTPREQQ